MNTRTAVPSRGAWLADLGRDLRLGARSLCRTPSFTIVTIASLGLGLGLVATTLAIINAYLLRSLPYPDADRLYHVMYAPVGPYEPRGMTALDWNSISDVVDATVVSSGASYYLGDGPSMRFVQGTRASRG